MNPTPTLLIAGASGYIASRLIPRLLEQGYQVRCLARIPRRLANRPWAGQVEIVCGDATRPESLAPAFVGVNAAYYLIHSMAAGTNYHKRDLQAARNFSAAAKAAGVEQIIYLGGLADPQEKLARHLRSRIETGAALREAGVPVTEFRAGVIAGPGSISFEMIRFIAEQFPLILGPLWLRRFSQPIAVGDVITYLQAALQVRACRGQIVEIGCAKPRTYLEVMLEYARIRGLRRRALLLPFIPPLLMALVIAWLTPVEFSYALPLVEGLQNDSLVKDSAARRLFPAIEPLDYAEAVRRALAALDPRQVLPIWFDSDQEQLSLRRDGFLVKYRVVERENLTHPPTPPLVNDWEVVEHYPRGGFLLKANGRLPGGLWFERRATPAGKFSQTLFWAPKGLKGFLYWPFLWGWWNFLQQGFNAPKQGGVQGG